MALTESRVRTGLRFGYPDGYYRSQYPGLYSTPTSATAALDLEMEEDAPSEGKNGMPSVKDHPARMTEGDLTFREWLKFHEVGTSTACVAGFKRMAMPMRRREMLLGVWGEEDPFFKKKKDKKKKS